MIHIFLFYNHITPSGGWELVIHIFLFYYHVTPSGFGVDALIFPFYNHVTASGGWELVEKHLAHSRRDKMIIAGLNHEFFKPRRGDMIIENKV